MKKAGLARRLRTLRALVLDVDGVLTDGGMYYGPEGETLKKFNVKDGMGLRLAREAGLAVAFITAEETDIVRRRAEKLKIADVYTGADDKLRALDAFLAARGLTYDVTAYVGDDLNDLPPLRKVAVPIAVRDAVPEVLRAARWITARPGGQGAVREVCDAILAARNSLQNPPRSVR